VDVLVGDGLLALLPNENPTVVSDVALDASPAVGTAVNGPNPVLLLVAFSLSPFSSLVVVESETLLSTFDDVVPFVVVGLLDVTAPKLNADDDGAVDALVGAPKLKPATFDDLSDSDFFSCGEALLVLCFSSSSSSSDISTTSTFFCFFVSLACCARAIAAATAG